MTGKKILILGETTDGRRFRPSDWAERVAGCCALFSSNKRLKWHELLQPKYIENKKCLELNTRLHAIEPRAWVYVLEFVMSNRLKLSEAGMSGMLDVSILDPAALQQFKAA